MLSTKLLRTLKSKGLRKAFCTYDTSKTFYAKDLKILKAQRVKSVPSLDSGIEFGYHMSDYMLEFDYEHGQWDRPFISEYHKLAIDPCNSTLHYAVQLYEGLKAYKDQNDNIRLFRPDMNCKRLLNSAKRICLPQFDSEEFMKCLGELLKLDSKWIPNKKGFSLYIRPCFISMSNQLGIVPPRAAKLFVICSMVGPYFKSGMKPVTLVTSENIVRAWPGGFGNVKLGANYAPTLEYYQQIVTAGHQQVLWIMNNHITEVGVMNFFVYWINEKGEKELITCSLTDGTILPGVTRDSVIQQAKEWGIKVNEREFKIEELTKAIEEKRVVEAFGTGTAAVISPVSQITHLDKIYKIIEDGVTIGELSLKLYNRLMSIQYGEVDNHPWSYLVK